MVRRVLTMFSNGWQAMQTRSTVASAASLNSPSSSAVISPTLLAMIAGSTLTGGLACCHGKDAPAPIVAVSIMEDAAITNECSFMRDPLEIVRQRFAIDHRNTRLRSIVMVCSGGH